MKRKAIKLMRVGVGIGVLGVILSGYTRAYTELVIDEFKSVKKTVQEQRSLQSEVERTALSDTIIEYNKYLDKMKFIAKYTPNFLYPSDLNIIERIK